MSFFSLLFTEPQQHFTLSSSSSSPPPSIHPATHAGCVPRWCVCVILWWSLKQELLRYNWSVYTSLTPVLYKHSLCTGPLKWINVKEKKRKLGVSAVVVNSVRAGNESFPLKSCKLQRRKNPSSRFVYVCVVINSSLHDVNWFVRKLAWRI